MHKGLASTAGPVATQRPVGAPVGRAPNIDPSYQNHLFVNRRCGNGQIVPSLATGTRSVHAPVQQVGIGGSFNLRPVNPAVCGAVDAQQAVVVGAVDRVHVIGVCRGGGDFRAKAVGGRQTGGNHGPGSAKVSGTENARVVVSAGVEQATVAGHALYGLEGAALHQRPGNAAVRSTENAVARGGYYRLGLGGMDGQSGDPTVQIHRHGEARGSPRLSAVDCFQYANGIRVSRVPVSGTDVHGVRIQGVDGNGADAQIGQQIRVGGPGGAVVVRTPQAARRRSRKQPIRHGGMKSNGIHTANARNGIPVHRTHQGPVTDSGGG